MIMEGNTLARQRDAAARGVRSPGGVYLETLDRLYPEIRFDVVNAAEAGAVRRLSGEPQGADSGHYLTLETNR